jgi:hypothetical protein
MWARLLPGAAMITVAVLRSKGEAAEPARAAGETA